MLNKIISFVFDLQLFADPNDYVNKTTDNTIGSNDLSPEMKTYYDMRLIDEAGPNLVYQQFGQKRPIPKGSGKTIEFRKFSKLPKATTPLTEGVTPAGQKLDVTTVTATLSQYGDYIAQSDVLELTALDNTILEATKLLGQQAGLTLDTVVRDIVVGDCTNVRYADSVNGSTVNAVTSRAGLSSTYCKMTVDTIEKAATDLKAQNAPTINGSYVAILHPHVVYDLRRNAEWIDAHKYAQPDELYNGEVGQIAGVRIVETTEAKIIRGENLAGSTRTLAVNHDGGYSSGTTIAFDGGTVAEHALKGKKIVIGGVTYTVSDNTASAITTVETIETTIANDAVIYPEGSSDGGAVYCCMFLGENAYGVTDIDGGGLQTIVKQKGSAGAADPLDQRSSIGWKAMLTAKILVQPYILRVECCSKYSNIAVAN